MMLRNKLDQSFGPVGTTAGIILFVAGLITAWLSLSGIILVLLGAFVGFSSTGSIIDFEKKRIKFSNNLFGFIPVGKWIKIEPAMKVGMKESNITWRAYSRSNRPLDIEKKDFRLILLDSDSKEIMEIMKSESPEGAKAECESLAKQLGINSI